MVICTACPYESKYPVSGAKIKYNVNLIGEWRNLKNDLSISRVDDYNFNYVYDDHDEDYGAGRVSGKGYAVTNNGATYLVIQKAAGSDTKYLTYKLLNAEEESFAVIPLDEDNMQTKAFNSAEDFNSYLFRSSGNFPEKNKTVYMKALSSYNILNRGGSKAPEAGKTSSILFSDSFIDNMNNWFSNYDFKDSVYAYVTLLEKNNFYRFENYSQGQYAITLPYTPPTDKNYSISVATTHRSGVTNYSYGLRFGLSDSYNSYDVRIASNGYYRIVKWADGKSSDLAPWTTSSYINQGTTPNTIEVRLYDGYFEFYLNDHYITRINDYKPFGRLAAFVIDSRQSVEFDDLVIKKL